MNPLLIKEVSRYNIKISFSELHLSFDVGHYHSILDLVEKIKSFNEQGLNAFFIKPIRFLNPEEKWIYLKDQILKKSIPKIYLLLKKVLKMRQLVEEYTKLLYIVKIDQKSNPSELNAARIKNMEILIPSDTLSEINIRILEENKKVLEREKNVTFLGSIYNKFFGWNQPSFDESKETIKPNTIISDVIALPEDFSANQISYQVSFTVTAFKISMFERDMAKQILNFELNELNINLLYKPLDMNLIKFHCCIFDIRINGYPEDSSVYHIINTNDICRKDPNLKFINLEYVARGIECAECKTCISLTVQSTSIHILLKFFLYLKELFYRPSLISVQKLKNYAFDKITEFSDIIVDFIRSSAQNIELNIEFNRTSLVFLTNVDLFIIARFDSFSFKTFFLSKETIYEASFSLLDSEYKYYTVYLDINHFNIFYADKITFQMMTRSIQLDKMMVNYSILYPVKISVHFFANRDDSGKTTFSYTSHVIIDEIKLQLSFESIQIIQTDSATASLDIPFFIEKPQNQEDPLSSRKQLNIVLAATKFSINIQWNNLFDTDSVSSHKFMSNVYLLANGVSGEYAFLTFKNIFSLKCESMIISHQVNTWIHTIFLSNKSISLEYNIVLIFFQIQISQKNPLILKKSDFSLSLSQLDNDSSKNCLKLCFNEVYSNLHYNSMQHFVKFAEIIFLLFTQNPVSIPHGALAIPPPSTLNNLKIMFSVEQSMFNILYHHKTLFSTETNRKNITIIVVINANLLNHSDFVDISFSILIQVSNTFMSITWNFETIDIRRYLNLLTSRSSKYPTNHFLNLNLTTKISFSSPDLSLGLATLTCQFEADLSNLQLTFLYRSLLSFQNWISCMTSNNTAFNQAIKAAYDTASTMNDNSQKSTKIIAHLTIKDTQIIFPVKSYLSGGICINCNQLELKTNVDYSNNLMKFCQELLIFINHVEAKAAFSHESNSDLHMPVSVSLEISQIDGTMLPEDIVMLKFFMIENAKELPKLHEDSILSYST
ncbi:hypothetical protein MXB_1185 [Myxobolus squamalis]|nr:hypothetical protein MXB_1185 [Myxobolus squamalis]